MPSQSLRNRDDVSSHPPALPIDVGAIMAGAGEVAFEWSVATDDLGWDERVAVVLGVPADRIATGRGYAALIDPQTRGSRNDVILNSWGVDDGSGIRYETQYALLPEGPRGRRVIVEDVGRWFADPKGRPVRVAGVVRVINERHEREQRILFLSRYDELTGHLNRPALLSTLSDALGVAIKSHATIAFMVLAVDNFRAINEACGFEVADHVFATVAQRIRSTLRDGDTIGRFGGNKIGLLLRNCADVDMPSAAERFQAIARSEVIGTHTASVAVTVSCGGVTLPRHGRTLAEAVARAQEALDAARLAGDGRFAAYRASKELAERRRANAVASNDLAAALGSHALVLAHRPVVATATRSVAFSEAVLRIHSPDADAVLRDSMIDVEGLGLMRLADERALQLVFGSLERAPQARVAFGVSADTVGDATWLAKASARLLGRPEIARRMIVQIPGAVLGQKGEAAMRFAGSLRDLGCAIAISDFGAGTASLRLLNTLGADCAWIDCADMGSERDRTLVRGLIHLARTLGIKTIASGVATEESAALLAKWGADYLQGSFIGDAVVADPPPVEQGV